EVAEAIHFEDDALEAAGGQGAGAGNSEAGEIVDGIAQALGGRTFGEQGGGGGEDVAGVEGITDRLEGGVVRGARPGRGAVARVDQFEHAVIRGDEEPGAGAGGDGTAAAAHARIYDDQVDGPGREVGVGGGQGEAGADHVKGFDGVAQIDEPGVGVGAQ